MLNIIPPHDYPRSPPRSQTYSEWANKFWNISFRKLDRKTLATLQYLFSSPFTCIIICRFSFRRPDSRNSFQWSAPYQVGGRTFQKVILSIGITHTQNDTMFSVKFFKHQVLWMLQPISQLMEFAIHLNSIWCVPVQCIPWFLASYTMIFYVNWNRLYYVSNWYSWNTSKCTFALFNTRNSMRFVVEQVNLKGHPQNEIFELHRALAHCISIWNWWVLFYNGLKHQWIEFEREIERERVNVLVFNKRPLVFSSHRGRYLHNYQRAN